MGAQCQSEHMTEKEGSLDLKSWADSIIAAWDPYMELTISKGLTPDSLKPITRVMYASALIPGGKQELDISTFGFKILKILPSVLCRILRNGARCCCCGVS